MSPSLCNPYRFSPYLPPAPTPGPLVTLPAQAVHSGIANLGGGWWRVENYDPADDGTIRFQLPKAELLPNRQYQITFSCRVLNAPQLESDFCDVELGMLTGVTAPGSFAYTSQRASFEDPWHFIDISVWADEDEYYGMAEVSVPVLWLLPINP